MVICEPCVGDGALAHVLADRIRPTPAIILNDIDPRFHAMMHEDASKAAFWDGLVDDIDWVITNPAFSVAAPILHHAWRRVRVGVIMHVRLSFLEATKTGLRRDLLRDLPPKHALYLPRIRYQFNDKGVASTDSVTCAWLVWSRVPIPHLPSHVFPPEDLIDYSSTYRPPSGLVKTDFEFYPTPRRFTEWLCDMVFPDVHGTAR